MTVGGPAVEPTGPVRRGKTRADVEGGFAVPATVRARMEPIVGGDLSAVRLHTDPAAARRVAAHGALAVAEGRHVAFAAGAYRPGTLTGEAILAHELAHTRQQSGGDSAPVGEITLERQADHAGYLAALQLLDPTAAARMARPEVSMGHGLRLQRCTTPDIARLPTREEYERRGELMPLALEETPWAAGPLTLSTPFTVPGLPGAAPAPPQVRGEAEDLASAPLMSATELLVRLDVLEAHQQQIDFLVTDLSGGAAGPPLAFGLFTAGGRNIALARGRLLPMSLALPPSPAPGATPAQAVPDDRAALAGAVIAAGPAQRRILAALQELRSTREDEQDAGGRLEGYDLAGALVAVDEVRRGFQTAAELLLTPSAAATLTAAEQRKAALHSTLTKLKLDWFQHRTSEYDHIQKSITAMHQWADHLRGELDALDNDAAAVQDARTSRVFELPLLESKFARRAELVAASIEALGEWDRAVRAYELLKGNTALWGYADVDVIAARLGEMRGAAYAGDVAYLRLLLRDHRADSTIRQYYASLPSIVEWSHLIIGLGITLLATVATAGAGLIIGMVAETVAGAAGAMAGAVGFGATTVGYVVVSTEFVVSLGGEALVFSVISRQLSSLVPGMAPQSSFWAEFVWNCALFGVMKGATVGAKALVKAMAIGRAAGKVAVTAATHFAALEAFGYFRFAVENKRSMTLAEFGSMSAQNAIMMGVVAVTTGPLQPFVERMQKAMPTTSLARLARAYKTDAARIAALRAALEATTEQRIADKPNANAAEASELVDEAERVNGQLQTLVDEVARDPQIVIEALPGEVDALLGEAQATPVPELLPGLEKVGLQPTGDPAVWTIETGKGDELLGELEKDGNPVTGHAKPFGGHEVVEAVIPGKGEVTFVERDPAATAPVEPVAPVVEALAARSRNAKEGLSWVRTQTVAPTLLARLAEVARTAPGTAERLLDLAGRARRAWGGPDQVALAAGGEAAAEALAAARAGDQILAATLDAALQDPAAARGLARLPGYEPRHPTKLPGILAATSPETVPQFLRATADPDLGTRSGEFYQALARDRAACDLAVRYGGKLLLAILRMQPGRTEAEQLAYASVDVQRVLQGLDSAAEVDPGTAAARRQKILELGRKATPQDLDELVGPRPRAAAAIEPKPDHPSWRAALEKAEKYTRDHPAPSGVARAQIVQLRAALFQVVARAKAGEFGHLSPAERTELLRSFNDLAEAAQMSRGWISAMRGGGLNEALARGADPAGVPTVWHKGNLIRRGGEIRADYTVPDGAWPPVTQPEIDSGAVKTKRRRWYEDKSYRLERLTVGLAAEHLAEARADLTNLPADSTIALRYSNDPGPIVRRAMADKLYEEPRVDQVIFQGEVVGRRRGTPAR